MQEHHKVVRDLTCQCGAEIIKAGILTCPRCHQSVDMTSESDVKIDEQGRWKCQKCLEHGKKPRTLAIRDEIKCRQCRNKNPLFQKEEIIMGEAGISEEMLKKTARDTAEWMKRLKEYGEHVVYYIEENEEIIRIPGGRESRRRKYIYDQTDKIAAVKRPLEENVKLITEWETLKKLEEVIQHWVRALNKGNFVRKLDYSLVLHSLLEMMHGYDVVVRLPDVLETEAQHQERKKQYLNKLFDLVIS